MNQRPLTNLEKRNPFGVDLCKALAALKLHVYVNYLIRHFFETHKKSDSETNDFEKIIRGRYLQRGHGVQQNSSNFSKHIWISLDETTDVESRFIAIVGSLESNRQGVIVLLHSEKSDQTDHYTIGRLFDKSTGILWSNGVKHENVPLFLSDATQYMVKASAALKVFYPKMIHVTCTAHVPYIK